MTSKLLPRGTRLVVCMAFTATDMSWGGRSSCQPASPWELDAELRGVAFGTDRLDQVNMGAPEMGA